MEELQPANTRGPVVRTLETLLTATVVLWVLDAPQSTFTLRSLRALAITLTEGRNRQVKRMYAAVGLPVLRLVRVSIGGVSLFELNQGDGLSLGQSISVPVATLNQVP